jgi:folate-dependent phosphoribosylglycinamide formyltransferase PurN
MQVRDSCAIAILTSHGPANYALINSLHETCTIELIVFQSQVFGRFQLLLNRLRKLGLIYVIDQMLFKFLDVIWFQRRAARNARKILGDQITFDRGKFTKARIADVGSVNSPEVRNLLHAEKVDVVIVSGTSILDATLLQMLGATPVINIHCGITPRYRGNHGAFWAIVNGDWTNVGTTVHFVDTGIDTGGIISQKSIELEPTDDPRTIGLKQYAVGIRLLSEAIPRVCAGDRRIVRRDDLDSRFYSSPTLTSYLRFRKSVKEHFSQVRSNSAI